MVYNCVSFSSNLRLAMDAFLKRVACAFVTFGLVFVLPIACKGGLLDDVEREIARDDANSPFVFTPSDKMAFSTTEQKVYLESDVEITTIADIKNDTRQNLTATLEIDEKDKVLFENAPELTSATCVDEVSFKFKFRANAEGKEAYVRIRLTKASGGEFGVKEGWIRCNSRPAVPEVTFVGGTDKIKIEKPTAGSFEDIKDVIVTVSRSGEVEPVEKCEKKYRLSDLPVELKMYKTSTAQGLFGTAVDGMYRVDVEAIDAVGLSSSGQTEDNISYMRHNVTFFANGGKAVPQQLVIKGDKAAKPEVSYPGHSFGGWYQDVGYTSQWDFGEPVEKDLLLYAKWNSTATSTAVVKINDAEVSESEAWKMLKAEVAKPSVSRITIKGKIKATSDAGNNGVIQVNKTLTIEGTDKDSDVLDASNLSGIFAVTTNGYLELSNLTLRNGKLQDTDEQSGGGAIYCEGSIFLRDGIIITECQDNRLGADKGMGGAVYCKNTSTDNHDVALINTVIKNCTASNGGGIAVFGTTSAETSCGIGAGVEISGCTLLSTSGKGKAVYIKGKGILDISETAYIKPDNDVYIDENCYINTTAELQLQQKHSAHVLTLTPYEYKTGIEFVKGEYRKQNAPKFAVTPQKVEGGDVNYTINNDGKLEISSNIKINNETVGKANAWKALKDAVENPSIGDTITINGSIKATFVHKGVIKVNRKLTIKGTDKANDILDADNFSGIFEITEDGELTLENLTLQNGYLSALDAQPGGGAIYCCGKLTTNYVVIKNCHDKRSVSKSFGYGGAIYVKKLSEGKECKATLTNTEIEKCSAWCGGGIAVADGAICSIGDDVHIKSCEFSNSGSSEHYGKAVFLKTKNKQGSILQIGGSLDIPTNDKHDVYISKSCYIEIISNLTGKANAVLTLTPYEYNTNIEFVKGAFRTDENVSKLDVTAYKKGVDYRINTDGKLVKK